MPKPTQFFVVRYAGWLLLGGLLFTLWSTYYAVKLYKNLHTNLSELLPHQARSVQDLNQVTKRLKATENLGILIFSSHVKKSKKFVIDFAKALKKLPPHLVSQVEYRIDQALSFFKKRRALYLRLQDLKQIKHYLKKRILYEHALYNPLNIFRSTEIPEPKLKIQSLIQKYQKKVKNYTRFPKGFYATADEKIRVILVYFTGKLSSVDQAFALRRAIDQVIKKLKPKTYAPDLRIRFTGDVQNLIEEHLSLIADLERSTVVVLLLVSLVLFIYFRSFWATASLILSLLMGTSWTFGISFFLVGFLNANSAFLGAIILGNGINFGIIFLARYLEERQKNRSHSWSLWTSMEKTATATWTAALAAGLAYGSLTLTSFRGFSQFGLIGLLGMMLCWFSAFTMLPAWLTVFHRLKWFPKVFSKNKHFFGTFVSTVVSRYPKIIWSSSVLLSIFSLSMILTHKTPWIEMDLSKLRDSTSMKEGSGYLGKYLDKVFERYLSPLVILAPHTKDVQKIVKKLKHIQKQSDSKKNLLIARVQSIFDFIPKNQKEKIDTLSQIKNLLTPQILKGLSLKEKNQIKAYLNPIVFRTISSKNLPKLVREKFLEQDGTLGKLILVEPPIGDAIWNGKKLLSFVHQIRNAADAISPHTPVAGQLTLIADMYEAIVKDGPRATLFAFLAIIFLVSFLFRKLKMILISLTALLLGVLWLLGSMAWLDWKMNFLNFIALPITFGIGMDYAINVFQRYRLGKKTGKNNMILTLKQTGSAVALSSLTTILGYGSLLLAGSQAFVSFGKLAVLGELTCIFAALFSLPAWLYMRDKKKHAIS